MSKPALWNLNVQDADAREAAREAARRQGTSLGEWLHGAASDDQAMDDGSRENQPSGVDDMISTSEAGYSRRQRDDDRSGTIAAPRASHPRRQTEGRGRDLTIEAQELILARAIEAMERRTLRNKRRESDSVEPAPHADAPRVSELAERISDIEGRLTGQRAATEENPVKATLARLEARLEAMSRPPVAEPASVPFAYAPTPAASPDAFRRLEEKVDWILRAVQNWPSEVSQIALAASRAAGPRKDRFFDDAVGEIARHQRMLEEADEPVSLKQAVLRRAPPHRQTTAADPTLLAMQGEIAALAAKIEGLCRDVVDQRQAVALPPVDWDRIRTDVANVLESLQDLAQRADVSDIEAAIQSLSNRIDTSPIEYGELTLHAVKTVLKDLYAALGTIDGHKAVANMSAKLREIASKCDQLEQEATGPSPVAGIHRRLSELRDLIAKAMAQPLAALKQVERLVRSLGDHLDRTATPRGLSEIGAAVEDLREFVAYPPVAVSVARIETGLAALDTEVEKAIAAGTARRHAAASMVSSKEQSELETLVRDLSRKMEEAQTPGADHKVLDELQNQIAVLSARFESSEDGFAKLNALQHSMHDVLSHLEKTRTSIETSAADAAREVLRIAIEEGQAQGDKGTAASLSRMQAMQDDAEARTGSALSAVQETLSKVVDRLASMESDLAGVRSGRQPQAPSRDVLSKPSAIPLGAPDPLLDQVLGTKPTTATSEPKRVEPPKKPTTGATAPIAEPAPVDFIAAARRAANAVKTDLRLIESKTQDRTKPASPKSEVAARTILVNRSRDYVQRHKRPALLGLAALFVIFGSVALKHRISANGGPQEAGIAPKVQTAIVSNLDPHIAPAQSAMLPAVKPVVTGSAKATAGTDPVQTASIASLPVFAAPPPRKILPQEPAIPVKLKAMAQAGDAGAEYVLGTQYAEGRGTPRDFKTAASWYQKAADKGVVPAQYRLASLYEKGLGVGQDRAKARSLYLQAAEAGNPRAMHNLAVLLADGEGKPDYAAAATWFRKAAQYGMEDSQFNLAILLARGLGVQQSLVQSYQWFAVAAAQDDQDAAKKRDEVGSKLSGADLAVAKALAASFKPRSVAVAATEVQPPPGGWDSAPATSPLNSAKQKVSSL